MSDALCKEDVELIDQQDIGVAEGARVLAGNPIFVVGMNGSGTTMMLNCLDAHSKIYGFPRETQVIPYYVSHQLKYGDLSESNNFKSLWDDFRNLSCFRWVNNGDPPPLPEYWRQQSHSLSTVIDETFGYFAQINGKQRWCEKTPMYAQHIGALHKLFPDAYFVHMIRDGRSCAASFHRRWGFVPKRSIFRWKKVVKTARRQANECGAKYIEVFYENLTRDPVTEMRRVCDFVGVKFEEGVLSPSQRHTHTGTNAKIIVQSASRWATYFNQHQVKELENIAGSTLTDLGYEVTMANKDNDPSRLALWYWMVCDDFRRVVGIIWQHITTPKNEQWDDLSGKIKRSILQRLSSRF